jgi:hypothetical protein
MEKIRARLNESSWYYDWIVQRSRARDGMKDYIQKAQNSVSDVNLSVKVHKIKQINDFSDFYRALIRQ